MIARGLTNAQVAARLDVTVHAVKFHLSHIYQKLGVSNRTAAAVAFQSGGGGATETNGADDAIESVRKRIQAAPPVLALPAERHRSTGAYVLGVQKRRLSSDSLSAIEDLAVDAPVDAVAIAVLAALVHRYSGERALTLALLERQGADDVADRKTTVRLIDVDVEPDMTFGELTEDVAMQLAANPISSERSLSMARRLLDPESELDSVLPLLVLANGTAAAEIEGESFDLALALDSDADGASASMYFPANVFDPAAVARMLGHVEALLEAAKTQPSLPLRRLGLLTEGERRYLLEDWNATPEHFPNRCLHDLLADAAGSRWEDVAVVAGDSRLTYGALETGSTRLARHLQRLGVNPGELVAICVDRSPAMLVGLLGILKAGAAYVPVDPTYPDERKAFMLEDAQVRVVVTEQALLNDLPATDARVVCLDRDRSSIDDESDTPLVLESDPEQLAYVIYTSGSTGKPKGVEIPHRALVNFLNTMADRPGLTSDETLLAVTTLSFDIAGLELYLPLLVGATVVLASHEEAGDPRRLMELLDRHAVTTMQATPTTWRMLIDAGWPGRRGLKVLCGGEGLPALLAEELLERDVELWNMYGPTETTIWSTTQRLMPGEPLTIGRPIGNTTLYILDAELQPTPVGVPGELHIGGSGLARGYRGRPDLTAERFIAHPFDAPPGARIYKTGDLATYRADGTVEFLGRLDNQVKVRGFRIELGEIETALARHPAVRTAVVAVREDAPGQSELAAYVITDESAPSSTELRRFISNTLPDYMVPPTVTRLDEFPLTPNGKIDRKALPAPPRVREEASGFVAPRTELERRLVEIWERVLDVRPIGIKDDFFELGVSSIVAAQLFAKIEHELGHNLPLGAVFQAPTVESLAALLEGPEGETRWTSLVPIQSQGTKPPIFCVHGGAGTILHLQPLARRLGGDQPFYALQSRGLYGGAPPLKTVEEMSAHYLAELKTVQPDGPYYLAGYCFGTIVAFDMAQLLRRSGEDVHLLAMFNGPSPSWIKQWGWFGNQPSHREPQSNENPSFRSKLVRVLHDRERLRRGMRHRVWKARRKIEEPVERRWAEMRVRGGRPVPERLREDYFLRLHALAERAYEPGTYDGEILMFSGAGLYDDLELGWTGRAKQGVRVHTIPGDHRDNRTLMNEPYVGAVAEILEQYLQVAKIEEVGQ
jgi:amino acid adenylation domain-containing protein